MNSSRQIPAPMLTSSPIVYLKLVVKPDNSCSPEMAARVLHTCGEAVSGRLVMDLLSGFRKSQVLFTAVELGVFDRLAAPAEGQKATALAEALKVNNDALERLLQACVGLELLAFDEANHTFMNTPVASKFLTRASDTSYVGYVVHSKRLLYPLWGDLLGAVKTGQNRWESVFGKSASDMFNIVYDSAEGRQQFSSSMHSFGVSASPHVVKAFDLGRFTHLVDIGGGTGHLAVAACREYPQLRSTVVDLPVVLPSTLQYVASTPEASRVELLGLDFFDEDVAEKLPKTVDLFALSRILHDWDDDTCVKLLCKLHKALKPGGCVLLAEMLLDANKTGPLDAQLQSLNMLVQTHGRERTAMEFGALLGRAGFRILGAVKTSSYLDAVLAEKVESA